MKDKKTHNICDQCDRPHLASHSKLVGWFYLCFPCWASHPWNPKEVLKTS